MGGGPAGATRPVAVLTLLYLALGVAFGGVGLLGLSSSDKLPLLGAVATRLPNLLGGLAGEGFHANQVAGTLLLFAPLAVALTLGLLFFPGRVRMGRAGTRPGAGRHGAGFCWGCWGWWRSSCWARCC